MKDTLRFEDIKVGETYWFSGVEARSPIRATLLRNYKPFQHTVREGDIEHIVYNKNVRWVNVNLPRDRKHNLITSVFFVTDEGDDETLRGFRTEVEAIDWYNEGVVEVLRSIDAHREKMIRLMEIK